MVLKIILRPIAILEIDEAVDWYEKQNEKLGEEFLFAFRDSLKLVSQNPDSFRKKYKTIRAFSMKKFLKRHHVTKSIFGKSFDRNKS